MVGATTVQSEVAASVWSKPPAIRGEIIEKQLGQNLPRTFDVIDKFENGLATSIKSMDLGAPTYSNPAAITRVGEGYIDKVANFNGARRAGANITANEITGRALDLAVPPGATASQQAALDALVNYGRSKGVTVNIVVVK